eukprot:8318982-Lingulodinium_polyedra.AAC.1
MQAALTMTATRTYFWLAWSSMTMTSTGISLISTGTIAVAVVIRHVGYALKKANVQKTIVSPLNYGQRD